MACSLDHDDDRRPPPPFECTFDEFSTEVTQCADISLPIEIDPSVRVGRIQTDACGDPVVVCSHDPCHDTCRITITQRLCVRIPLTYYVSTCVEDPNTRCCTGESCCG